MKVCIGIDVGGTQIKFGIFTLEGKLLEKWQIDTNISNNGKHILQDIKNQVTNKLQQLNIALSNISGIGMGMPGPVREDGYMEKCINLGLERMNPAKELSDLLGGIPVVVGNDANVAALGEKWQGSGKQYQNLVLITLGTGVGSGVIIGGKIVYGKRGVAGEIGHLIVKPDMEERCNCGGRGCLEQIASASGLVRHGTQILNKTLTAKEIVDGAKSGDLIALEVLEYCMDFLGRSLADISVMIDPEAFIIGGGLSSAGEFLLNIIRKSYAKYSNISKEEMDIILAELGNDAGIYGAAKLGACQAAQ